MRRYSIITVVVAVLVAVIGIGPVQAVEMYYTLDTSVVVTPSNTRIAVQLDTTRVVPDYTTFVGTHPALDASVAAEPLARGFSLYGIAPGFGYAPTAARFTQAGDIPPPGR